MKNEIKTQRLYLREILDKDANLIVSWRSDPKNYKFFRLPHKLTLEEHEKWYSEKYLSNENQIQFIAIEDISQSAIGVFGVRLWNNTKKYVEVSYLLDNEAQGKGYAQEAVWGLMKFTIEKWNVTSMIAVIHKENKASIRMIQKLEFQLIEEKDEFLLYERQLCCI